MVNKFLRLLDKPFFRPILMILIRMNYFRKGINLSEVKYIPSLKKWYYKEGETSFLSISPGWAYCYSYLLNELKKVVSFYYLPKNGDVVVDIGAGIGEETIIFSKLVADNGLVYSIEAHPTTFKSLKYIIEDNTFRNVKLFNCAISDTDGLLKIEDDENSYLKNSIGTTISSNYFEVPSISLDSFVKQNNISRIDFLKSNIEGAEQLMIGGMEESIKIIRNITISCHDFRYNKGEGDFFKTKEKVTHFLKNNGFTIRQKNSGHVVWDDHVYASKD